MTLSKSLARDASERITSVAIRSAIFGTALGLILVAVSYWSYIGPPQIAEDQDAIAQSQDYKRPPSLFPAKSIAATVVKVHDGDTIFVRVEGWPDIMSPIAVRVASIDCPELNDKRQDVAVKALAAKTETIQCCPIGSEVQLYRIKRDKYFRLLASVEYKSDSGFKSLSDHLIEMQLAKPYSGSGSKPW